MMVRFHVLRLALFGNFDLDMNHTEENTWPLPILQPMAQPYDGFNVTDWNERVTRFSFNLP